MNKGGKKKTGQGSKAVKKIIVQLKGAKVCSFSFPGGWGWVWGGEEYFSESSLSLSDIALK